MCLSSASVGVGPGVAPGPVLGASGTPGLPKCGPKSVQGLPKSNLNGGTGMFLSSASVGVGPGVAPGPVLGALGASGTSSSSTCLPSSIPFHGDFSGCSNNAQALFAAKADKQENKWKKGMSLFNNHDFVIVEETHNQEGRSDVFKLPERFRAFWSNGTASTAGVGIILQRDFLAKFDPVDEDRDWVEIEKGYAACLRLRGPSGALDILLYLHAYWKWKHHLH